MSILRKENHMKVREYEHISNRGHKWTEVCKGRATRIEGRALDSYSRI